MKFLQWLANFFNPKQPQLPAPAEDQKFKDGRELPAADEGRHVKLAIVVGHTKAEPGASLAAFPSPNPLPKHEYSFNSEIARLIKQEAEKIKSVDVEVFFRDGVGIQGAYKKAIAWGADACIELHFNAFNGHTKGSEVLATSDLMDVEFAHLVLGHICRVFGRDGTSRGVKCIARTGRGGQNVHSFPAGVNCLVEPFFGDNVEEARMAWEKRFDYAKCLVEAVNLWAIKKGLI